MKAKTMGTGAGLAVLLLVILLGSSLFVVSEAEQAVITQFGRPVRVIAGESPFSNPDELRQSIAAYEQSSGTNVGLSFGAGLYFKVPFLQKVEYFEDRILVFDSEPATIMTGDQKRLIVDNFSRWYIVNPLLFRQTVENIPTALNRLDNIIRSDLRNTLGENEFIEIIRGSDQMLDSGIEIPEQKRLRIKTGRTKIMERVTQLAREKAKQFGIYVIDVRIKRADPPEQNMAAIYNNMTAERNRIAQRYRALGSRQATYIKSETDRKVKTILAEAERDARIIKGNADAEAARTYAQGYIKEATGSAPARVEGFETDPEFYGYLRSLDALEASLDAQTTFILSTKNELLRQLNGARGE